MKGVPKEAPHQVQRQAIVREDDDEEDDVDEQVQHVRQQLQVEHVHALRRRASKASATPCNKIRGWHAALPGSSTPEAPSHVCTPTLTQAEQQPTTSASKTQERGVRASPHRLAPEMQIAGGVGLPGSLAHDAMQHEAA